MNHINCKRRAQRLIESVAYKLYVLKLYGMDKCPTAHVTPQIVKRIAKAEESVAELRRAWTIEANKNAKF